MAKRIGKYKISNKEWAINLADAETGTFSAIDITGAFEADGLCQAKGGLTVTGAALTVTGQSTSLAALTCSGATVLNGDVDIGNATSDEIGFYGVAGVDQAAHIDDPAETAEGCANAIDAILVVLEQLGLTASS